ncbi:modulator of macroautophagy TMEM150B isoform X2 [Gasterosteus aculeatus]
MWQWALLPLGLAAFGTVGIWIVFATAVFNRTVDLADGFPSISHCGAYPPQRCFLSQICSTCSVLALWIVVLRFKQVSGRGIRRNANIASFVLGLISCVGLSIVGSFQVTTFYSVHLLGAFLAFFLGLAYFWIQLFLTVPSPDRRWVEPAKATCCFLCTGLIIALGVLYNTGFPSVAAMCEWAFVMLIFCLFGLFAPEFRHIDGRDPSEQNPAVANELGVAETYDYVSHALS